VSKKRAKPGKAQTPLNPPLARGEGRAKPGSARPARSLTVAARKDATGTVTVRRVAVSKIKAAAYNPRKDLQPGDAEYDRLARSIENFGYVDPLIWNEKSGNLVGGHQRLKVLLDKYRVKTVDVSVVSLSPADERALNVALNKVAGDWDDAKLATLLAEMRADEALDVTLTGFENDEIDVLIATAESAGPVQEHPGGQTNSLVVIVECSSKKEQARAARLLRTAGLTCRVRKAGG